MPPSRVSPFWREPCCSGVVPVDFVVLRRPASFARLSGLTNDAGLTWKELAAL